MLIGFSQVFDEELGGSAAPLISASFDVNRAFDNEERASLKANGIAIGAASDARGAGAPLIAPTSNAHVDADEKNDGEQDDVDYESNVGNDRSKNAWADISRSVMKKKDVIGAISDLPGQANRKTNSYELHR